VPVLDSYARLLRNPSGRLEKVDTQHADNEQVIARLGGVLSEQLSDNSLSAWNPKVRRPGRERLGQSPETVETSIVGSCGRGRASRAGAAGLLGLPALWAVQGP